jgi:crotonobetainyl-CoA:carnitine CoA-transferase CaiB-like acyl-CoA transferase
MVSVMEGVRILEVAEHTFVPAASALLSDWGADVIKIEHVERGDAMRGLASTGVAEIRTDVHALLEHSNRGKRSLALDLSTPDGLEILYRLAAHSDVFLTNKLPSVRSKLKIGVEDIRARNPQIIYVRGTGQGELGPDADKGSYDSLAFWARSGAALGVTRPEYGHVPVQPGPAFGDSIGAMTIAGSIMGALFHRERTGEATTVDVSLFGTGLWAQGATLALSLSLGRPWEQPDLLRPNPVVADYQTSDGRWLSFTCLQAGKYWPLLCQAIGHPEWASDERFQDQTSLLAHSAEAGALLKQTFAQHPLEVWRPRLADFTGQWAVVQDTIEAAADPQAAANGYIQNCETADGLSFQLVAAPVQFGGQAARPRRAPQFNEHGDEILAELGMDWDDIVALKVRNIVA